MCLPQKYFLHQFKFV